MMRATMYFAFGTQARSGLRARTTFDAILSGERTSTTRFANWPNHAAWARVKIGDEIEFFDDRMMKGRSVRVRVTAPPRPVDLATCSADEIEAWSQAEGWTVQAGRDFGRKNGRGLQIRYERV